MADHSWSNPANFINVPTFTDVPTFSKMYLFVPTFTCTYFTPLTLGGVEQQVTSKRVTSKLVTLGLITAESLFLKV